MGQLQEKLATASITIVTTFARAGEKGLNVGDLRVLRTELRALDSEYEVQKKTLIERALKHVKKTCDMTQFNGSIGLIIGRGDQAATAKAAYGFAKKKPALKLLAGFLGNQFVVGGDVIALAKLPSREVMIGQMLGMLQYPLTGLVNVLQGNIRGLAVVLSQIAAQKQ